MCVCVCVCVCPKNGNAASDGGKGDPVTPTKSKIGDGTVSTPVTPSGGDEDFERATYLKMPRKEVIARLRRRAKVVTFFGETDEQRALRLKEIEDEEGEMAEGQR